MARKKKTDEDESNEENLGNNSDDTFGLPDIEYKPLNREEETSPTSETQSTESNQYESPQQESEQKPMEQPSNYTYEPEEEGSSVWPKVLIVLLILAVAGAAGWYFLKYKPARDAERKAQEQLAAREQVVKDSLANVERIRLEKEQHIADSLASIPKTGTIETLSERTRRYYVVIASAVDDDLLMDYAKKLSTQGVSTKIIPPFAKYKFFRLTVADGDTFASTQEVANAKKAEYGDALWVLKY